MRSAGMPGAITIFSQAGEIEVPADSRSAFAYLERSVVPVRAARRGGIFHPKVWVIRFVDAEGGDSASDSCALSRNLTFERSWDTILRHGRPADSRGTARVSEPLGDFVRSLPNCAVAPMDARSTIRG